MEFFLSKNYEPSNTWYRDAGNPRLISYGHFLMRNFTKLEELAINNRINTYLDNAFQNRINRYGHAADVVQQIEYLLPYVVFNRDSERIKILRKDFSSQLNLVKSWENFYDFKRDSGIETDFSFTAHNEFGRQIYNGSYGEVFIENVSKVFSFLHDTTLKLEHFAYINFSNYLYKGYQWTFFNKILDNSVIGRDNTNSLKQPPYVAIANSLNTYLILDPPLKEKLTNIFNRINTGFTNSNYLKGNKYFWRSDMMVHRNRDYYFSVRMTSDRTVAPEAGNSGEGVNFYAGAGVTHLMKKGTEYTEDYSLFFNERRFPGTTVEQDSSTLPVNVWGSGGNNTDAFAGGLTDGKKGTCAMIWDKRGLKAHKAWFMFENEIIALGAGIRGGNDSHPVITTINQAQRYNDPVYYKLNEGSQQQLVGNINIDGNLKWIFHNSVAYLPLEQNDPFEMFETRHSRNDGSNFNLFSIGINHGENPIDKGYAYLIKPSINLGELDVVSNNLSISIIENSTNVQAIYNSELDVVQAVFYEAGQMVIPEWENTIIKVNEPSLLMITYNSSEDTYTIVVSNPKAENSLTRYKKITFKKDYTRLRLVGDDREDDVSMVSVDQNESVLSFDAWNSRWGGQSSRQKIFERECSVVAATNHDGNFPYNTRDNSLFSRWSSYGNGEFIQYRLCDEDDINYVDIAFYKGNQRYAYFEISVSKDENAQGWEKILVNKSSNGITNEKQRFYFDAEQKDIKYIRYTGYGNSQSLWNSITEFDWGKSTPDITNSNDVKLVPNPTFNSTKIISEKLISKVSLFSKTGILLKSFDNLSTMEFKLDLINYNKGIYLVKILLENGNYIHKWVIKQ